MIKISIITATFNSIKYLPDLLDSISQQTYTNYEHIVIDGGSTDGTLEYLRASNQVHHIVSEKDDGIYDALNKGLKIASGEVIGFLHSDDMFDSCHTLQQIRDAFVSGALIAREQKKIDLVYGDLVYVKTDDSNDIIRVWKSQTFKPKLIRRGWMPPHPTVFLRNEVFKKHGFYNNKYKIAADYDYLIGLFQDKNLTTLYLPKVITKMRSGGVSNKGIRNLINKSKEDYLVIKNHDIPFPLWVLFMKNLSKIPQLSNPINLLSYFNIL